MEKEYISLNEREIETFELWKKGLEKAEIAKELCISPHTVKSHISKFKRLNLG